MEHIVERRGGSRRTDAMDLAQALVAGAGPAGLAFARRLLVEQAARCHRGAAGFWSDVLRHAERLLEPAGGAGQPQRESA